MTLLNVPRETSDISESEEERCDAFIASLPGAEIFRFSRAARAQIPDLPDRRYYVRGVALWAEIKAPADRFYVGQFNFLQREYHHGELVFAGTAADLQFMVTQRPPSEWLVMGWQAVCSVRARGFRDVPGTSLKKRGRRPGAPKRHK